MPDVVRTFIAVEIPHEVQDRAGQLIERLSVTSAKVRWVEPRNLHWTIKFLGDVDLREVPAVCQAVSEAAATFAPFDMEARGAGAFPDPARPRTVWLGVGEGTEKMIALHDAIERSLGKLGFREEGRRFRPHVTIGRVRSSPSGTKELAGLIHQNAVFDGGLSTVYEVAVVSSQLGRGGPTYEVLGHVELKG